MSPRPYVVLSAAMSADGYLDDRAAARLVLSDGADLDQVDELRARSDAILVGAQTVRSDNPRLQPSAVRQQQRVASGLPASPLKVTVTGTGDLDPASRFFTGDAPLVYAGATVAAALRAHLTAAATIVAVPGPDHVDLSLVLADLADRGVGRLMVEGGARVLHELLAAGLADEFRLAIAPVIVADPAAPRLVTGSLRAGKLRLTGVTEVGRMVVLRYVATATS